MKSHKFIYLLLIIAAIIQFSCKTESNESTPSEPLNVVFLLVDDLGWMDLSCYGSAFYETPNIDRLAKEGMRFTNAYASCPVCSPTRASVLTGQYPARLNITDWIPGKDPKDKLLLGPKDHHELPLDEITLAEQLKAVGYQTAFFGKWHLGEKGFYPEDQGFDINKGGHWAGQPASYFYPYKNDRKRWDVPGLDGGEEGEYLTDRLTQESIRFMREHKDDPFLIYLAYYNVHTPIQAKEEYIEKYKTRLSASSMLHVEDRQEQFDATSKMMQDNPTYAGMVQSVDESVGRILDELNALGINDNTLVVFTSDNGGLSTLPSGRTSPTSVAPLRAGKGWLYEGGIRVPAIIKWPNITESNSTSDVPISSIDYYPTLMEAAGLARDPNNDIDGLSLLPILNKDQDFNRESLFWHYPHYHGSNNRPSAAIRSGDYKLIEWMEDGRLELYNLDKDLSEQKDVSADLPEITAKMKNQLNAWQQNIKAQMPSQNPDYIDNF